MHWVQKPLVSSSFLSTASSLHFYFLSSQSSSQQYNLLHPPLHSFVFPSVLLFYLIFLPCSLGFSLFHTFRHLSPFTPHTSNMPSPYACSHSYNVHWCHLSASNETQPIKKSILLARTFRPSWIIHIRISAPHLLTPREVLLFSTPSNEIWMAFFYSPWHYRPTEVRLMERRWSEASGNFQKAGRWISYLPYIVRKDITVGVKRSGLQYGQSRMHGCRLHPGNQQAAVSSTNDCSLMQKHHYIYHYHGNTIHAPNRSKWSYKQENWLSKCFLLLMQRDTWAKSLKTFSLVLKTQSRSVLSHACYRIFCLFVFFKIST